MATHIMTSIAIHNEELVTSEYLASSLNTNAVVVRRILGSLQKAGLVETIAGRRGGTRLNIKSSQISLFDVFAAVDEENVFAFNPNDPNKKCALSCRMKAVLEPIFKKANQSVAKELKKVLLSDLINQTELKPK